ncbi:MAG: chalcone isomerase family protein [Chthoniobacterales bacterium]|nr:chalcone isomerase family protein [Chthoniobacterales bacterium]
MKARTCIPAALAALASLLLASFARASEFPAETIVDGQRLVLNGSATRTVWGFGIYHIGLFLTEKSGDEQAILANDQEPKRIHIRMVREVGKQRFTGTVQQSLDQNFSPEDTRRFASEIARFLAFFHQGEGLKQGTEITIDFIPARGMVAAKDGVELGVIPGADFYHKILGLWIGKPLQKSIKDGLLGRGAGWW